MAKNFVIASSNYYTGSAPVTDYPLTMAAWIKPSNVTAYQFIMNIAVGSEDNRQHSLTLVGNAAGDPIRMRTYSGSEAAATTTTGVTVNTWHHACGVVASNNERHAWIDGGSKGSNTGNRVPTVIDTLRIGSFGGLTPQLYFGGLIAEAAIWNAALTDGEVKTLAAGVSPLRVRPQSLKGYWPLFARAGNAIDYSGLKGNLTETNGPIANADHGPVGPMFGFDLSRTFGVAAPPAGFPYSFGTVIG